MPKAILIFVSAFTVILVAVLILGVIKIPVAQEQYRETIPQNRYTGS